MDQIVFAGVIVGAVALVAIFATRKSALLILAAISAVAGALALYKSFRAEAS